MLARHFFRVKAILCWSFRTCGVQGAFRALYPRYVPHRDTHKEEDTSHIEDLQCCSRLGERDLFDRAKRGDSGDMYDHSKTY